MPLKSGSRGGEEGGGGEGEGEVELAGILSATASSEPVFPPQKMSESVSVFGGRVPAEVELLCKHLRSLHRDTFTQILGGEFQFQLCIINPERRIFRKLPD